MCAAVGAGNFVGFIWLLAFQRGVVMCCKWANKNCREISLQAEGGSERERERGERERERERERQKERAGKRKEGKRTTMKH